MIIDSQLTNEEALKQNPADICPPEILARQMVLTVQYYGFDDLLHQGQIVIDERLADDIKEIFQIMKDERFPIQSVIPVSDLRFKWSDEISMEANNSSAFNYRLMTLSSPRSYHALGQAVDINPKLNPYINGDVVLPRGAVYDLNVPGTISADSFLVKAFKKLGWQWGGAWQDLKDYQHFEKKLD